MLKGLRVVELATVLAGPAVGQFFAECGAEVIKVENPLTGGDVTRSWKSDGEATGDRSAYFCSVNWGKKSIALDLSLALDQAKLMDIVRTADIVIVSYKPGDAGKLGTDYETLRKLKSDLIYGSITGYGSEDTRVGYDAVIQAESGFMDMNGEPDGPPLKMPVALMDLMAAHQLKEGLLLALIRRQQTGLGSIVEVSLIDSALASLANQAGNYLVAGRTPKRQGSLHPNIAPYGEVMTAKDGTCILLAVGSDKQFHQLCSVLKNPAWAEDPRFNTNQQRVANRKVLADLLTSAFSTVDAQEILAELHRLNIPAGSIQTVKEALTTDSARRTRISGPSFKGVRTFVAVLNAERRHQISGLSEPPSLAQHNADFGI